MMMLNGRDEDHDGRDNEERREGKPEK